MVRDIGTHTARGQPDAQRGKICDPQHECTCARTPRRMSRTNILQPRNAPQHLDGALLEVPVGGLLLLAARVCLVEPHAQHRVDHLPAQHARDALIPRLRRARTGAAALAARRSAHIYMRSTTAPRVRCSKLRAERQERTWSRPARRRATAPGSGSGAGTTWRGGRNGRTTLAPARRCAAPRRPRRARRP